MDNDLLTDFQRIYVQQLSDKIDFFIKNYISTVCEAIDEIDGKTAASIAINALACSLFYMIGCVSKDENITIIFDDILNMGESYKQDFIKHAEEKRKIKQVIK
jgi:hypothetical protein